MLNRFTKKIKRALVKFSIRRNEKHFVIEEHSLKYYYAPCKGSDALVVVFSGFSGSGKPAAYNMIASFSKLKANRLYILDDFGFRKGGAYYLGENGTFFVRDMVLELLKKFNFPNRVFCGSSKGGTAAIYFGLLAGADLVIAGAPQFYIGDYLMSKPEHIPIFDALAGGHGLKEIEKYNRVLPEVIESGINKDVTSFLMHYSPKEHTYSPHISPMLNLMKSKGYIIDYDVEEYENHSDVAKFFPELCVRKVNSFLNKN